MTTHLQPSRARRWLGVWGALALGPFASACGLHGDHDAHAGPESGSEHGAGGASFGDCAGDTRARPFEEGSLVWSEEGALALRLESSEPSPPAMGSNTLRLRLETPEGVPIEDATLRVEPWMPDHAHGGALLTALAPTRPGDPYVVEDLSLFMPGIWELRFQALPSATAGDGGGGARVAEDRAQTFVHVLCVER